MVEFTVYTYHNVRRTHKITAASAKEAAAMVERGAGLMVEERDLSLIDTYAIPSAEELGTD